MAETVCPASVQAGTNAGSQADGAQAAPSPTPHSWHRWGGALNSARADGAGFFDRKLGRAFIASVEPALQKYVVELNSRSFLPLPGGEILAPDAQAGGDAHPTTVYLQFGEHPGPREKDLLTAQRIELLLYAGGCAWTARARRADLQEALKFDFVRAVAAVDARDKLHPALHAGMKTPDYALATDGRTRFMLLAAPGTTWWDVLTELDPPNAPGNPFDDDYPVAWEAHPSVLGPRFEVIAHADQALKIAALDQAVFVGLVPPPAAARDAATDSQSNVTDVRDAGPLLSGAGVRVMVRELGRIESHVDFVDRLTVVDNDGATGQFDMDHATAVTGQIGSNGNIQPSAKGVAPGVSLSGFVVGNTDTFTTQDVLAGAAAGIRVSNHSYGPSGLSTFGDYDPISADWDAAIRANDLLGMFAGNEEVGGQFKHIDFFVGAKNTICVSSTTAAANAGDDNPPTAPADGLASFGEHGPMNDGRIKPDLMAFGESVTLDKGLSSTRLGTGTSFSTPAVTGVAALVFQQYRLVFGRDPSAALAKALLCNSATDLGLPGPDASYGFGLVNAEAAITTVNSASSQGSTPFFEDIVNNGETKTFTVNVSGTSPLKVTLCWMDVAGVPTAAKALINDLDMELAAPDGVTVFFPFSLDPANPTAAATASAANTVDPIEQVLVASPAPGVWTIRVKGTSVPQGPQSFAVSLNVAASPQQLSAFIVASPTTGPAPLAVSFSAAQSTGGGPSVNYKWEFGDGGVAEAPGLIVVDHTYTSPGGYKVRLTLTNPAGAVSAAETTITVGKPEKEAFGARLRGKLNFDTGLGETAPDDTLQFTMVAIDLVRTPQQARDDLKSGAFEGRTFQVRIGGLSVADVIVDRRASFRDQNVSFKLNLAKGEIRVQLKKLPLEEPLKASEISRTATVGATTFHDVPVEIVASDVLYRARFRVEFANKGKNGTVKTP